MEYNLFVTQDCCQFKGSQRLLGFQGSRLLLGSIKYKVQNAIKVLGFGLEQGSNTSEDI